MPVFLVTYVLFPACVWLFLLALDRRGNYPAMECLLYALGLAPALAALALYYALLMFPGGGPSAYVLTVGALFLVPGVIAAAPALRRFPAEGHSALARFDAMPLRVKAVSALFWVLVLIPLAWFLWHYLKYAFWYPLNGHDVLEYACQGKFFFNERAIYPFYDSSFPGTGIVFASKHAPGFPLLLTWGRFYDALGRQSESDLFFRSIGVWYGFLILAVQAFWLSKLNRWLALLGIFAILGNSWFFAAIVTEHHLDTFRIFLLMLSWIWLARHIYDDDRLSLYIFGACAGLAAFAHSIGMVLVIISLSALFLFARGGIKARIYKAVAAALLALLFGGGHYLLDLFCGRHWVIGY